jgi:hypothetical protein
VSEINVAQLRLRRPGRVRTRLIREPTAAGLAAARARPRAPGWPTIGHVRPTRPGFPRRCTAPGGTRWRPSPRPSGSAEPRSVGTSSAPTAEHGRRSARTTVVRKGVWPKVFQRPSLAGTLWWLRPSPIGGRAGQDRCGRRAVPELLVDLVVDLGVGSIALHRLDALDRAGLALVGLAGAITWLWSRPG